MQPRGRLDISLSELLRAALPPGRIDRALLERGIAEIWGEPDRTVVALSVRSAFVAALATLDWPVGTVVLMSAINIADMGRIVTERGFRLIPLEVDPDTLAPDPTDVINTIERLRADQTNPPIRALCLTHLFGSRIDLAPFAEIAKRYGLQLWEDAAQAFTAVLPGPADKPAGTRVLPFGVNLTLTSFGLIKTQTALGGGLAIFRDADWCERTRRLMETWPMQTEQEFLWRGVFRGVALSLLTHPVAFTLFAAATRMAGSDLDAILGGATRGFAAGDLGPRIRRQPAYRLLALLLRRLQHLDPSGAEARARLADQYRTALPESVLVGRHAHFPTTWVFPIRVHNPDLLREHLARAGYDATRRASRLVVLEAENSSNPDPRSRWLDDLLYLPLHPGVSDQDVAAISRITANHLAQQYAGYRSL